MVCIALFVKEMQLRVPYNKINNMDKMLYMKTDKAEKSQVFINITAHRKKH